MLGFNQRIEPREAKFTAVRRCSFATVARSEERISLPSRVAAWNIKPEKQPIRCDRAAKGQTSRLHRRPQAAYSSLSQWGSGGARLFHLRMRTGRPAGPCTRGTAARSCYPWTIWWASRLARRWRLSQPGNSTANFCCSGRAIRRAETQELGTRSELQCCRALHAVRHRGLA